MKQALFPLLHRCILRELTLTFIMCVSLLLALILISRGLLMRDLFLGLDFSGVDIALLFFYMVPMFMIMVLPISCMISVFLTFLRMSADRELVALKVGGVSIYQMLRSPALFSFLCMCLALFISMHAIAWGMSSFRSTILHIANTKARLVVQPGVFNKDIFGLTFFARQVDPASGRLQQIIFEDETQDNEARLTVLAPEGDIVTDNARGALDFHLRDGRIYRVDKTGNISILEFEEYKVSLDLTQLFSGVDLGDLKPKEMSWDILKSMSGGNMPDKRLQRKVAVEIQKRWSLPVACLVLGVFALPLACAFEGVRRQLGVILALLMFLLYYAVFSLGLTLGESGRLHPVPSLWFSNLLFALAAIVGLHLAFRERVPSVIGFTPVRRLLKKFHRFKKDESL
ncbi:LptF/LptG family permease [Desulfovibrio sp. OttesenSCG-928-F20]|nr:LptF/LptG family permease [Desulfovibrio sp. OttesenSCG-928-M16]MDL2290619.1 LptF/LptG family permease [Desulfovibrio sp. OttesenSCG-928-F20]